MANLNKPNRERNLRTVSVQLTPDQISWLEEQKWTQRRSIADLVRDLLDRAMAPNNKEALETEAA